jgi:hypothetical protein
VDRRYIEEIYRGFAAIWLFGGGLLVTGAEIEVVVVVGRSITAKL